MKLLVALLIWLPLIQAKVIPGRYIVELTGEPVAARLSRQTKRADMRSAAAQNLRAEVREEHRKARTRIEAESAEVLESTDTVANTMLVRISDARAARLAQLPGVARVRQVREYKLMLDRAVVIHRATEAWAQIGIERAGAGAKIGIIDTGIDVGHPGMQDAGLALPDGYPRVNVDSDLSFTNAKVIVARSYAALFSRRDPDQTPRDHVGHGTALAMAAAGARNTGPLATIMGMAPRAYLGNYKVFGSPGVNDGASDDAILKAIDDAVADGMDVINLSLGSDVAPRPEDDILVSAIERASRMGVIVVVAAGNNGPDPSTIGSPATAPSAIAVGASGNDRIFSASVSVEGVGAYAALPASGSTQASSIRGSIVDVESLDGNGLSCSQLPATSLANQVALILRGVCTFEQKLNIAQRAGAIAALVYTDADRPVAIQMSVGAAGLPAEMISYESGLSLKQQLKAQAGLEATLQFSLGPFRVNPNRLADFSSRGPSTNYAIKPELLAVGTNFYTATQSFDPNGDMFDSSGYISVQGTSFSTPLVAGAAALLKSARPGLTVDQYRSLLIDSAASFSEDGVQASRVQQAGAGTLDVSASLRSTITAFPTALNFGIGGTDPQLSRTLTIANVGAQSEVYRITVAPRDPTATPLVSTNTVSLDPGASYDLRVDFTAAALARGAYEGFIKIQGSTSEFETRIPYWYAIPDTAAQRISVLDAATSGRRGASINNAFLFRMTDVSGVTPEGLTPEISVVSGGGEVLSLISRDSDIPGAYSVRVRLGPLAGANVFRISAGNLTRDITLTGR